MNELAYLRDLVIILGFGVIIVTLFHKLKLPAIAGFILAGVLVGPQGLGFINDVHQVEVLATKTYRWHGCHFPAIEKSLPGSRRSR